MYQLVQLHSTLKFVFCSVFFALFGVYVWIKHNVTNFPKLQKYYKFRISTILQNVTFGYECCRYFFPVMIKSFVREKMGKNNIECDEWVIVPLMNSIMYRFVFLPVFCSVCTVCTDSIILKTGGVLYIIMFVICLIHGSNQELGVGHSRSPESGAGSQK